MNNDDKTCSQCGQKDRCGKLYEKLGQSEGPSVAWKVIVAFLMPILVFIISLAVADKLLQSRFEDKMLIAVSFLAAAAVTTVVIVVIWAIRRSSQK